MAASGRRWRRRASSGQQRTWRLQGAYCRSSGLPRPSATERRLNRYLVFPGSEVQSQAPYRPCSQKVQGDLLSAWLSSRADNRLCLCLRGAVSCPLLIRTAVLLITSYYLVTSAKTPFPKVTGPAVTTHPTAGTVGVGMEIWKGCREHHRISVTCDLSGQGTHEPGAARIWGTSASPGRDWDIGNF